MKNYFSRKMFVGLVSLTAMIGIAASAMAGGSSPSKVTGLWIHSSTFADAFSPVPVGVPVYVIATSAAPNSKPACSTGRYATKDKAQYDLAMAAFLSGKNVEIMGMGVCGVWRDAEDIGWLKVQ